MTDARAAELLAEAAAKPVEGWNLTQFGERLTIAPLPWSFDDIAAEYARRSPDLLDLGTGGGEWLAALAHRPARTVATESWPPNVPVARERLAPLGVEVVYADPPPDNAEQAVDETRGRLPFADGSFSLVTSRHTAFVASEVARVLRDGGDFVTQQVGGDYGDFHEALGLPRPDANYVDLALATMQLERAGLRVADGAEGLEETTFTDVGAFAWYLKAIPWTVEGFTVDAYRHRLERLHERLRTEGPITVRLPAFWLAAEKN